MKFGTINIFMIYNGHLNDYRYSKQDLPDITVKEGNQLDTDESSEDEDISNQITPSNTVSDLRSRFLENFTLDLPLDRTSIASDSSRKNSAASRSAIVNARKKSKAEYAKKK